jgi:hypothetical protein
VTGDRPDAAWRTRGRVRRGAAVEFKWVAGGGGEASKVEVRIWSTRGARAEGTGLHLSSKGVDVVGACRSPARLALSQPAPPLVSRHGPNDT